jgi:hypothetical protein
MTEVYWFANNHEDRNDWLRLGLMRLHASGAVHFEELPLDKASSDFGFDPAVTKHTHRHTSVVALRDAGRTISILIDSEDSFFWMSPLVASVDVYFCAGYNRDFFVNRKFEPPYSWQTAAETSFYRERAAHLIENFGRYFDRVLPFSPIGPNLHLDRRNPWLIQKVRNLHFRASQALTRKRSWLMKYLDLEARYKFMKSLRKVPAVHDVVLHDTLWGWPRHRLGLHRRLKQLAAEGYDIHSKLRWEEPMELDGGTSHPINKDEFPLEAGSVQAYEHMLAASRLGVFATGFHYGWRNIVTFAMMQGLPIYCDPFLIEHRQKHEGYTFFFNNSGDWRDLEELILKFNDPALLAETKRRNQRYFDTTLAPEIVARTMLDDALSLSRVSPTERPHAEHVHS